MAITRAQQVKQMLREGGRIGFRRGNPRDFGFDAKEAAANVGKASTRSDFDASANRVAAATNVKSMQDAFGTKDNVTKEQQDNRNRISDQRDRTIESIAEQRKDAISGEGPYRDVVKPNFLEGLNNFVRTFSVFNKLRNNPINEKKYVEYLKSQGVDTTDLEEIFDVDDEGKVSKELFEKFRSFKPNFDLEQQRNLFKNLEEAGDPFAKASAFPMDFKSFLASEGNFGEITSGDLGNLKDFKNPGTVIDPTTGLPYTDAEFEKLKRESGQGGSSYDNDRSMTVTDPCKGPNPPAYCFIGQNADDDDDTNTGGLALRFMSRGGSPMDAPTEGGIMDLESGRQMYFLGKLVKKATRAVKKVAKSPLGKAALGFAALKFGPAFLSGKGLGLGTAKSFKDLKFLGDAANVNYSRLFGLTALASPLFQEEEEDDDMLYRGPSIDPGYIRRNPYTFASQIGSGSGIGTAFAADGGRIGLKNGNGVADEEAENAKFVKRVRELMDEGFDMGEAVREAMKEGYADGGRIGLKKGSSDSESYKQYKKDLEDKIISPDTTFNEWLDNNAPDPDYDKSYANGGRTGFFMGSRLPQGLALVRQMLKFFSEGSKTGKTGSEMLKIVNPKQFTKYLEDPNTLFMKGSTKDGIMASDVVKDYASKVKGERAKMIEDLLGSAKNINKANKSTEKFKKEIIEEMISKGSNKEAAEGSAEILSSIAESAAGGKEIMKYKPKITEEGILQLEQIVKNLKTGGKTARDLNAQGGRIGLKGGTGSKILNFLKPFGRDTKGGNQLEGLLYGSEGIAEILKLLSSSGMFAEGGDVEPVAKKTMPLLDMDGKEMDLREEGGFVPIGRMEKADDVPARLSKNEFVFTADAVRNAGDGDVDKGAEVMYNMMKNLESGGEVSEESQGLEGAREMFQTSKRLEEVL